MPELLDLIRESVDTWNHWKQHNPNALVDLSDATLVEKRLKGIDLSRAKLIHSDFCKSDLRNADFQKADLTRADLSGADLRGANLAGADLRYARLSQADLGNADLTDTYLLGAALNGARFIRADLSGADLSEAVLVGCVFGDTNLTDAVLEEAKHYGSSILDHQTVINSGDLPVSFLRGCGLPDLLIEYYPSLLQQPIQFYSCFISYSEPDDEFAQRLYNDLQGHGIRCWRWKEDARWGRTLMDEIDKAVRLYDKLVVICSEHSLQSMPVIREIERALQREDRLFQKGEESEVLFPIRIDDYIFSEWEHHRKADVTAKYIGDFRNWKDHDAYQKALNRLIGSLRVGLDLIV